MPELGKPQHTAINAAHERRISPANWKSCEYAWELGHLARRQIFIALCAAGFAESYNG